MVLVEMKEGKKEPDPNLEETSTPSTRLTGQVAPKKRQEEDMMKLRKRHLLQRRSSLRLILKIR